jgi:predicted nucleotidyltransferase
MKKYMNWKEKLDIFMSTFEHANDVTGILVCGSYVTGSPTKHSDLDVHLVLRNAVDYRERGNKIIDGLLIEYFANPPRQILRYFDEDLRDRSLMAQTQFATGEILLDKAGDVVALKEKAAVMIAEFYSAKGERYPVSDLEKYGLWDMMDDLQDAHENNRADFDFLYHNCLNRLIANYMRFINLPYNAKSIYGNITDAETRKKYLLHELPDSVVKNMIAEAILATG